MALRKGSIFINVALDFIRKWFLVFIWCALIFYLSHRPDLPTGVGELGLIILILRRAAHVVEYAVLTLLAARSFKGYNINYRKALLGAGVLALLYAISDEYHQTFVPGRNGSLRDVLIDGAGIIVAFGAIHILRKYRRGSKMKDRIKKYIRILGFGALLFTVGIYVGARGNSQDRSSAFLVVIPEMKRDESNILKATVEIKEFKLFLKFLRLFITRGSTREVILEGNATKVISSLMEDVGSDRLSLSIYDKLEDGGDLLVTVTTFPLSFVGRED
jgi:VanZ family protein